MRDRSSDWLRQARRDLDHARRARETSHFEWVAFAAQQAAEKAVKAVALSHGWSPAGHRIEDLLVQAAGERPSGVVLNCAGRLTAHFGRARYPTGVEGPMPGDLYHQDEAEQAIADAAAVLAYCEGLAARS